MAAQFEFPAVDASYLNKQLNASSKNVHCAGNHCKQPDDNSYDRIRVINRWRVALKKIRIELLADPWRDQDFDGVDAERAIRYRYSAIKKRWVEDEILIKLQPLPFDHGSMRECFRLKKVPTNRPNMLSWSSASNYVAKKFIDAKTPRSVYFEDVRLQMEAKLWAEEFNRQNPPKKVDIFQLSVIDVLSRRTPPHTHSHHPNQPDNSSPSPLGLSDSSPLLSCSSSSSSLFLIEHFMDGNYRKYNSNSGFVDEDFVRFTPQTFSHFTFERSGHRLLVVDIQGVGDLYTDPQIHTASGQSYGDGNLGVRGMALFFHSHRCNSLCRQLGLTAFELAPSELKQQHEVASSAKRRSLEHTEFLLRNSDGGDATTTATTGGGVGRGRTSVSASSSSLVSGGPHSPLPACLMDTLESSSFECDSGVFAGTASSLAGGGGGGWSSFNSSWSSQQFSSTPHSPTHSPALSPPAALGGAQGGGGGGAGQVRSRRQRTRRQRQISESSDVDAVVLLEDTGLAARFHACMRENHKPASALHPANLDREIGHSILAQVHHELSCLHESGRIVRDQLRRVRARRQDNQQQQQQQEQQQNEKDKKEQEMDEEEHRELIDWEACLFHERHSAQLGCLSAIISMAHFHLGMPLMHNNMCPLSPHSSHSNSGSKSGSSSPYDLLNGLEFLWRAAEAGDRRSMIELANRYRLGCTTNAAATCMTQSPAASPAASSGIGSDEMAPNWVEAMHWYERSLQAWKFHQTDVDGEYDSASDLLELPQIIGIMAQMFKDGGWGLEQDLQKSGTLYLEAANEATNAMKGRMAAKYFELAEQLCASAEEEI